MDEAAEAGRGVIKTPEGHLISGLSTDVCDVMLGLAGPHRAGGVTLTSSRRDAVLAFATADRRDGVKVRHATQSDDIVKSFCISLRTSYEFRIKILID